MPATPGKISSEAMPPGCPERCVEARRSCLTPVTHVQFGVCLIRGNGQYIGPPIHDPVRFRKEPMATDVDAVVFEIDRSGDAPDLSVCFDDGDVRHPGGLKLQRGGQPCRLDVLTPFSASVGTPEAGLGAPRSFVRGVASGVCGLLEQTTGDQVGHPPCATLVEVAVVIQIVRRGWYGRCNIANFHAFP